MEETVKEFQELKQKLWEEQEMHRKEKEVQQGQAKHEAKHTHIDETMPIQVVDSSKQLAQSRQGDQSQEKYIAQDIEQMLEHMDTDMVQPESDQDIDLMPH